MYLSSSASFHGVGRDLPASGVKSWKYVVKTGVCRAVVLSMYVGLFGGVKEGVLSVLSIFVLRLKQQTLRRPNIPVELAGHRQ